MNDNPPIEALKYEWMKRNMMTKRSLDKIVENWVSHWKQVNKPEEPEAELIYGGSHFLGTLTPNSDIDAIVLTTIRIEKINRNEKCIINENGIDNKRQRMIRERICMDQTALICQLCKVGICSDHNHTNKSKIYT